MDFLKQLGIEKENSGASCGEGTWLAKADSARSVVSYNPTTGEAIATVWGCTRSQYEIILEKAQAAFLYWRTVPAPKRGEVIYALGQKLRQHKEALGSLVAYEMGKTKQEGLGEVQEMIDMADFAVGQSRMLYGLSLHSERAAHRLLEQWHPLGIVGVISAFNFPVAVWSWNAFLACICGNVVIWKPSSKTPLCAIAVQKLCDQVMLEMGYQGLFSLMVPETHAVAEALVLDKRVALIAFTGSCQVGKQINTMVAARMGRVLLELGGNNAVIVDESADLSLAIPAVVFGAVGTAGQRCTTTRRLLVHRSRYKEVCERLVQAYQQIRIGDPLDPQHLMGPLIDEAAYKMFQAAIETLKQHDATIIFGGNVLPRTGYFVEPTIVKAENHWPIVQKETFAPILYVMEYDSIEAAVCMQNAVAQGLSSALFTQALSHSEYFLSAMGSDCGIANVNVGTSGAEIGGAFGGEKETGGGREAGTDAWKAYMRRQTNTVNWGKALPLAQGIDFSF